MDRAATGAVALLVAALVTTSAGAATPVSPVPPLAGVGRWLVDGTGRVVLLHGVNEVEKSPPYYPAATGFGPDDVALLAAQGFNALRLGVDMRGLMPLPGQIDDAYVEHLATTVAQCAAAGIFVLLDFHQDGYAPKYNGNGFPDWMAIDDGLPNPPDAVFPLYYIQNPAMQRAFEHFWANSPIPDGLGLEEYYLQALARIASRFAAEPMILGTEVMNEPWPGAAWQPCIAPTGCPSLEQDLLAPFYHRVGDALGVAAPGKLTFVEPFVLFNFGQGPTSLPGTDASIALSFHSYALDVAGETNVARFGAEAAARDGRPVVLTEFGATTDPVVLNRLTAQFEDQLLPWMFWAYAEVVAGNPNGNPTVLDALVRPYPVATTGVPTQIAFDPTSKAFQLSYTTSRAGGGTFDRRLETVVFVPRRQYPAGYHVEATNARVRSKPCAPMLRLRTRHAGLPVTVTITPEARRRCPG